MAKPVKTAKKDQKMRLLLAQEAARILLDLGCRDFRMAKRKAAEHLGVNGANSTQHMPSNIEIEDALIQHQRLFLADSHSTHLQKLRSTALDAMNFLVQFKPKLVGPVLSGTADSHSSINLHLFCDNSDEINLFLRKNNIPFEIADAQLRMGATTQRFPVYRFIADELSIELTIFPASKHIQPPTNPVDGKPMQRASVTAVELLLNQNTELEID